MKIRTSFVTNSSSSSFIIARKEQFTSEQKEAILKFIKYQFLGDTTIKTKEELITCFEENIDSEILDDYGNINEESDEIEKFQQCIDLLDKGYIINAGNVVSGQWDMAELHENIWNTLSTGGNFIQVDTDLDF